MFSIKPKQLEKPQSAKANIQERFSKIELEIRNILTDLKNIPSDFEYDSFRSLESRNVVQGKTNKISLLSILTPKFSDKEKSLIEKVKKGSLRYETLPEFVHAMKFLQQLNIKTHTNESNYPDVIAHENAHMNVAESLNPKSSFKYVIQFAHSMNLAREKPVEVFIIPAAEVNTKDYSIQELIEILEAPDKYGEKMSDSDREKVQTFKALLKQGKK